MHAPESAVTPAEIIKGLAKASQWTVQELGDSLVLTVPVGSLRRQQLPCGNCKPRTRWSRDDFDMVSLRCYQSVQCCDVAKDEQPIDVWSVRTAEGSRYRTISHSGELASGNDGPA